MSDSGVMLPVVVEHGDGDNMGSSAAKDTATIGTIRMFDVLLNIMGALVGASLKWIGDGDAGQDSDEHGSVMHDEIVRIELKQLKGG